MSKKILSIIIAVFIFTFSVPHSAFAGIVDLFENYSESAISLQEARIINLLDISKKIVKVHYEMSKDFFFNIYCENAESSENCLLEDSSNKGFILLNHGPVFNIKNKYIISTGEKFLPRSNIKLRNNSFFISHETLKKQYLISLAALKKSSLPSDNVFYFNNIYLNSDFCL